MITKAVVFTHGPIDSPDHPSFYRTRLLLRQLDSSSKLLRQIDVGTFECANASYDCDPPTITDVKTDSPGNIYAMTEMGTAPDDVPRSNYTLYKYSRAGTLLWKKTLGQVSTDDRIPFEFDRNNNVFVAQNAYEGLSYFARYNPNGVKWWQRNSQVGPIQDIAVAGNGDIYIVGNKGMSRYSNSGSLLWTQAIAGNRLASTGAYLYLLQEEEGQSWLYKLNQSGRVIAKEEVSGLLYTSLDIAADTLGNVYLRGYENVWDGGTEPYVLGYVQKRGANGSYVWRSEFGFGDNFTVNDFASYNGSSIYVVGSGNGKINGANYGGYDAFILRLNAQGQKVWER